MMIPPKTEVRLLPSLSQARPGETFWVGIELKVEKGWHTYWQNPGDSGRAPQVTWRLPKGWTADALKFPVPRRFVESDSTTFGYESKVVLLTRITAGKEGGELSAVVNWMACAGSCFPLKHTVSTKIRVGAKSLASTSLQKLRDQLPQASPVGLKVEVIGSQTVLSLKASGPVTSVDFIPADPDLFDLAKTVEKSTTEDGLTKIWLKPLPTREKAPTRVKGIVTFDGKHWFEVELAV